MQKHQKDSFIQSEAWSFAKYGWKKFKDMYEYEMNYQIAIGKHQYKDNKYEIEAEKFGQKNWSNWYRKFIRANLT